MLHGSVLVILAIICVTTLMVHHRRHLDRHSMHQGLAPTRHQDTDDAATVWVGELVAREFTYSTSTSLDCDSIDIRRRVTSYQHGEDTNDAEKYEEWLPVKVYHYESGLQQNAASQPELELKLESDSELEPVRHSNDAEHDYTTEDCLSGAIPPAGDVDNDLASIITSPNETETPASNVLGSWTRRRWWPWVRLPSTDLMFPSVIVETLTRTVQESIVEAKSGQTEYVETIRKTRSFQMTIPGLLAIQVPLSTSQRHVTHDKRLRSARRAAAKAYAW